MASDAVDLRLGAFSGDLDLLLRAIDAASLSGAVLELDGDADELYAFVADKTREDPDLFDHNSGCRPGPWRGIWPVRWRRGGGDLRLPIEADSIRELRRLAAGLADPEVAVCLSVRDRDGTLLLSAPDIGDDEIWVNGGRVSHSSREAMRAVLGSALRCPPTRHGG